MKVSIRNIGKIACADIELNGLTAIIGDNDMGKSTLGKSLYALFASFADMDARLLGAKARYVVEALRLSYSKRWDRVLDASVFDGTLAEPRRVLMERIRLIPILLPRMRWRGLGQENEPFLGDLVDRMLEQVDRVRRLSREDLLRNAVGESFGECFDGQFLSDFEGLSGESSVGVQAHDFDVNVRWNTDAPAFSANGEFPTRDVWFIGTPLVLDAFSGSWRSSDRRGVVLDPIHNELVRKMRRGRLEAIVSRQVVKDDLLPVMELFQERMSASLGRNEDGRLSLDVQGLRTPLHACNLSMGLKMFSILRLLLEMNLLRAKDVVVLDEPENHLHPELQTLFARIIVRLQRIRDLRVLVTTHSPYFLQALELYSRLDGNGGKGRGRSFSVYQPMSFGEHGMVQFKDVSGDTTAMYRKFAAAMRELDILRRELDGNRD